MCGPTVYYKFTDSQYHNWGANEKDRIEAAVDNWEGVIGRGGGDVVNLIRGSGSPQIEFKVLDLIAGGEDFLALGRCDTGFILVNDRLLAKTNAEQDGVLVHEFGHVLGLSHVSHDDNSFFSTRHDTSDPTMESGFCASSFEAWESLSMDDHAALTNRQGAAGSPGMTADPSFESAKSVSTYFNIQNAISSRVNSANSPVGSYYFEFTGNESLSGNDPYVYQEEVVGYPGSVDASVYIRKAAAGDSGTVDIRLLKRQIDVLGDVPPGLGLDDDASCTLFVGGDWVVSKETTLTPTNSWTQYSTGIATPNPANGVVALRVSIVSDLFSCSAPHSCVRAATRIDDEKVREG